LSGLREELSAAIKLLPELRRETGDDYFLGAGLTLYLSRICC
jgi:hypothetical protein